VTSYMLGAPDGRKLGAPGYSHEFVARLFRPLLAEWGRVTDIKDPRRHLAAAVADCRRRGVTPVHFSVLPFQDVCLAADAVNVVMPAWERVLAHPDGLKIKQALDRCLPTSQIIIARKPAAHRA
jgi:hypothetical protein